MNTQKTPKISVIMPVYNGEKYLREAMDSILSQTYADFEFIVVDDGSKDSSAEIVRSYDDPRIRFVQNEHNMGVAATLNRGLDLACGEYIARMDADDISLPERFEKQVAFMDAHPEVAVCGSAIELFGAQSGRRVFSEKPEQMKVDMFFSSGLAHPSVMLRGSVFGKNGLRYDGEFSKMEDYELWTRVLERYEICCIPDMLLKYRIHPEQVTQKPSKEAREQSARLKLRLLKRLQVDAETDGSKVFLEYCRGVRLTSAHDAAVLLEYLDEIERANQKTGQYAQKEFRDSLFSVKKRILNRFSVCDAVKLAQNSGMNGISYACNRMMHSKRAVLRYEADVRRRRKNLRIRNFTIISNNCWGSFVYQKYGLKYRTPTVGLYMPGDDFVRFCADWQEYLKKDLQFIPWESARLYPQSKDRAPYPVALLGDVEIYFMHYSSEEEAREKWQRRTKRINPDRLIFKLSQRENCTKEDVQRFMELPFEHKLCFSYDDIPGAVIIPELKGWIGDETSLIGQHFDELDYLNRL